MQKICYIARNFTGYLIPIKKHYKIRKFVNQRLEEILKKNRHLSGLKDKDKMNIKE